MPKIVTSIEINAPIERAFDLSRNLEFHMFTQKHRGEKAVGGKLSGLITHGEQVQWVSRHLGFNRHLTAKITLYERPVHFRDTMIQGAFKRFDHDHFFREENGLTYVTDTFDFESPFGFIGQLANKLFLTRYMTNFFIQKNAILKETLETGEWTKFISPESQ